MTDNDQKILFGTFALCATNFVERKLKELKNQHYLFLKVPYTYTQWPSTFKGGGGAFYF